MSMPMADITNQSYYTFWGAENELRIIPSTRPRGNIQSISPIGTDDIMDSKSVSVPMHLIELQGPQHWLSSDTCLDLANGMLVES